MSITYDLYRTPMPEDEKNKVRYHARPVNNGSLETHEIAEKISERCSLTPTDVTAVLHALSDVVGEALNDGRRVHLERLGYFHISLSCEKLRDLKEKRVPKVRLKSITFRADKLFRREVVSMPVVLKRSRCKEHSQEISNIEIDALLTDYFARHNRITRNEFAGLCGLKPTTAYRHVKRLLDEKKLKNIGYSTHPIYVPVPGNYRISVDRPKTKNEGR